MLPYTILITINCSMGTGVVKVWNLTKERWNSIGVLEWLRQCLLASLRNTNLWVSVADAGRIRQNYIVPVTCYLLTFLSDMSGLRKLCKDVHGVTRVASLLRTEHLVTPFNLECIISGLNAIIILFFFISLWSSISGLQFWLELLKTQYSTDKYGGLWRLAFCNLL